MSLRVLFASSEAHPFSKTGGLGDVSHALPAALAHAGADLRLLTPAYRGARAQLQDAQELARIEIRGQSFRIWEGQAPGSRLRVWLAECAALYERDGTPYADAQGREFADNAWRFGCFSELTAQLAVGAVAAWRPEVLHLNDWQTGLAPVWLRGRSGRPRVLFTIHNLAYQGLFARQEFEALGVPAELWQPEMLEFWGRGSFLKSGLVFADALTTVSPSYAREIQTPEFGYGLEGVLRHRAGVLHGILNGIDDELWDPARDRYLHQTYTPERVAAGKRANRHELRRELGLEESPALLVGVVSRLAAQKGIDLLLDAAAELRALPLQFAVLGSGEPELQERLLRWAAERPGQVTVRIGYDEGLAHRIEAAADLFLMPSRYEPCGLNQMYSQRYGTIPVVRAIGGLADSVVDASAEHLADGSATGICFRDAEAAALVQALRRGLALHGSVHWPALQAQGMRRDFSWRPAAARYLELYRASA